ncbi:MAG TPA: sigma-70 family RNA polymerase sigma factor [Candidatus Polarisedimenticolaceae bacterium]
MLRRSVAGDRGATEELTARIRPHLKRWASGRLPGWARDGVDTDDLVQDALARAVAEPGRLEVRPDFQSYLRQTILNSIRDHVRRAHRRPRADVDPELQSSSEASPLEALIGKERMTRFEAALQGLDPDDREAIVCRVEFGMTYRDIALALGRPTADAARMAVARALVRLSRRLEIDA